jgi:alpha-L-rhamnosidase
MKTIISLLILFACAQAYSANNTAPLTPVSLSCEYLDNPVGIQVLQPRLSWKLKSDARNQRQSAYHVLVASSRKQLARNVGDIWDSGKVASDQSLNILYEGQVLQSRKQYFWKVKAWNQKGKASDWSAPASWGMAILSPEEWTGQWIESDLELFPYQKEYKKVQDWNEEGNEGGLIRDRKKKILEVTTSLEEAPAVWMRKEFEPTHQKIQRATLYISGLGLYEAYLNGEKINDHHLSFSAHDFTKSVPYHAHDVTQRIQSGKNALGVILGNGYCIRPRAID